MKVEESRSGPQVSVGKALQPVLLFKAQRVKRLVRRPDDDDDEEDNGDDNGDDDDDDGDDDEDDNDDDDDDLFIDLEIVFDACIAWPLPPAPGKRR